MRAATLSNAAAALRTMPTAGKEKKNGWVSTCNVHYFHFVCVFFVVSVILVACTSIWRCDAWKYHICGSAFKWLWLHALLLYFVCGEKSQGIFFLVSNIFGSFCIVILGSKSRSLFCVDVPFYRISCEWANKRNWIFISVVYCLGSIDANFVYCLSSRSAMK